MPRTWVDKGARAREALEVLEVEDNGCFTLAEKVEEQRKRIDALEEEKGALLKVIDDCLEKVGNVSNIREGALAALPIMLKGIGPEPILDDGERIKAAVERAVLIGERLDCELSTPFTTFQEVADCALYGGQLFDMLYELDKKGVISDLFPDERERVDQLMEKCREVWAKRISAWGGNMWHGTPKEKKGD